MLKRYVNVGLFSSIFILFLFAGLFFEPAVGAQRSGFEIPTEAIGPAAALDESAAPSSTSTLHLTFALNSSRVGGISDYVDSTVDPTSPNYRKWISAAQIGQEFGASAQDIATVVTYLTGLGLTNIRVWPDHLFITADVTTSQAESVFDLSINGYDRSSSDIARGLSTTYYAPDRNPEVDPKLAAQLIGIFGLSNAVQRRPAEPLIQERAMVSSQGYLDPPDLAKAYDITALHNLGLEGQGETIGIFSPTAFQQSDITRFLAANSITGATINIVNVNGGNTSLTDQGEACIDIETIVGQAPDATVNVYEGPNDGSFNIFLQAETDDPDVLSESYRIDENEVNAAYANSYETIRQVMAAEGISIFVASGDNGAYDSINQTAVTSSVDAASNYVTAVGGTELGLSGGVWNSEIAWTYKDGSTGGNTGSGGGLSIFYTRQSWQTGVGVSNSSSNGMRQVPDISALASRPYYDISTEGGWSGWAGTSCSTPLWASATALMEQGIGSRLGNIDPALYSIASTTPAAFHDVTSGNNGLYTCTTGWDFVTGLGSADFGKLYAALPSIVTKVSGFTPKSGLPGTTVTISGVNLGSATNVSFDGTTATTILSNSSTQIVAQVPTGATTGPIAVKTAQGTGVSIGAFTVYPGSYYVSPSPSSFSIAQGSTANSTMSLTALTGFTGTVSLSATELPVGVTVSFSPTSISGSGTSIATFTATSSAALGTWIIDVVGTNGTTTVLTKVSVTVTTSTPVLTTIVVNPSSTALAINGSQQFSALGKDQFGNTLTTQPTFSWSISSGVGAITQSGLYSAGTNSGSATIIASSGSITGSALSTITAQAPIISVAASASPNPVSGTTTNLSVLGSDDYGQSALTYTWTTTGTPPAAVAFSVNGTNAAQNTVATFTKAGTYTFLATLTDTVGLTTTSSVSVTVNQTLTSVSVTPSSASLSLNGTQQFSASGYDQFGTILATQPAFTWSIGSGVGSVSSTGLFTAGGTAGASAVAATSGAVSGSGSVTVTAEPPVVTSAASATPSPVTGTTTNLSVLGSDDAGAGSLTYTWSTTGTPPAAVAFSVNGTNAAQNTVATFTKAGTYTLQATLTDTAGLTTTSSVTVTVNQTLTGMTVSPSSSTVVAGNSQTFTAVGTDQFGSALSTQPAITFSVSGGTIGTSTGIFTSATAGGPYTVTAASGSVSGNASVTVTVAPSFTLLASPTTVNAVQGATGTSTISLSAVGGFSGSTALTVSGLPSGVTAAFSPASISGSSTSVLTFTASGTATTGSSTVTVTGTSGSLVKTTTITLNVTASASSPFAMVNLSPYFNLQGIWTMGVPVTGGGLDTGNNALSGTQLGTSQTWDGAPFTIGAIGASNVVCSIGQSIALPSGSNNYGTMYVLACGVNGAQTSQTLTVGYSSGSNMTYSQSYSDWVVSSGYSNESVAVACPHRVNPNGSAGVPVHLYGYTFALDPTRTATKLMIPTDAKLMIIAVTLGPSTAAASPMLTTIKVSPATATVVVGSTQTFTAVAYDQYGNTLATQPATTFSVSGGGSIGSTSGLFTASTVGGPFTVTASSGSVTTTAAVTVTAAPNFSIIPTLTSVTAGQGGSAVTNVGLSNIGGFTSSVALSLSELPVGVTAIISPSSISGSSTSALTFTVAPTATTGTSTITVTGVSGSLTNTAVISLTVASNPILTSISVTPSSASLSLNGTQQFSASGYDQFGTILATQPAFTWSIGSGVGSVSSTGLFTAGGTAGASAVAATSGAVSGSGSVTVTAEPPVVTSAASATPSPVTGTTTNLSVLGSDDAGAGSLTYTWSTTGTPPAAVAFSVNGTNAAQNTVATFTKAGTYTLQATLTDTAGLTTTSSVTVTVNQTLTGMTVSPSSSTVVAGNSQTFTAVGTDQFGSALSTQPAITFSVSGGTIGTSTGIFTSATAGGPYTVTAASGSVSGNASVTVTVAPSFTLLASPTTVNAVQGATGTSTISLSAVGGFSGSTALTVSGLPSGVTAAFSPASISGSSTSVLTFTASGTATTGSSTVTVTGTSGSLVKTTTITLNVTASASSPFAMVNLSPYFNLQGIWTMGVPVTGGGLDTGNNALSGTQLGTSQTWDGAPFTIGAIGASNVVCSIGQSIALPSGSNNYGTMYVLACGVNGAQTSQTLTVGYSSGSNMTYSQSYSDWVVSSGYSNESVAVACPHRVNPNGSAGVPVHLYGYTFALDPTRTATKLMIPTDAKLMIIAVTLGP